ncbi:hypothetical protein HRbin29_00108 [bacterium HR29]|nr:hypothetical protein HRbin29_00108 [bacterium HR29]
MAVYVWRPQVLAAVVTLLGAGAGAGVVIATSGHEEGGAPAIEVPVVERTFSPSEEELGKVRALIDADGRVAKVSGGQPYEIALAVGEERSDGTRVVSVEVVWERPVTTRGPWMRAVCRGTVLLEGESTWKNLRSVAVTIDLTNGRIRGVAPGHWAIMELGGEAEPSEDDWETVRVLDQPEGWSVKGGREFECPDGYEDESQ